MRSAAVYPMSRYRSVVAARDMVNITVDGRPLSVARGRTLLAALLADGTAGAAGDFHCAIGQCQRCLLRVDGIVHAGCLYVPKGGESVDTAATDGRPLP
ncbi:MAG: 2Fe-2S iron-sulfur cluster-binding protein [Acidobacteriota bacterium]